MAYQNTNQTKNRQITPVKKEAGLVVLFLVVNFGVIASSSDYLIGVGSYDITGPAANVNMMGYANMEQIATGIHLRLRARTFIVAEPNGKQVVFVNLDAFMASHPVKLKVLERLKARYGDVYTKDNVAISGTHTHAGPGGYLQYVVYLVTSLGFVHQSLMSMLMALSKVSYKLMIAFTQDRYI